jgi:hypothetical protein
LAGNFSEKPAIFKKSVMQHPGRPTDFGSGGSAPGQPVFTGQFTATGELASGDLAGANLRPGLGPLPPGQLLGVPFDLSVPGRKRNPSKNRQPRLKTLPTDLDIEGPSSNADYQAALADSSLVFSPQALGFLPSNYWLAVDATFSDLVTKFFQRKNNANCRFPHKLYNALALVEHNPMTFHLLGVQWVTDRIFKVDKLIFGRLLGIIAVDGGLFHRQGNFPSHGFAELATSEIEALRSTHDLGDVDQDRVRLLYHKFDGFAKGSTEDAVTRCKWITEGTARL